MDVDWGGISTDRLGRFLNLIRTALEVDDKLPNGQKEFRVREEADWKVCADEIESVLRKRNVRFTPIRWDQKA